MKSKHSLPHGTRNTPAKGNAFPSRILLSLSGLSLLLFAGTSHAAGLTASDGAANDYFGYSVSQSGSIGLVGAINDDIGANTDQGSAYVFRSLDTAIGSVTQNVKLTASDGAANDTFGNSVSQSGSIGLVGAYSDDVAFTNQGSAYVFRNLEAATGTITQNVKLTASDGATSDYFGSSVSQSGSIGLVGAGFGNGATADQGAAYVFRNLDTATGTVTQNVKLIASDGAANDLFGLSVSLSGSIGLVGVYSDDVAFTDQGSAYVFRNLDTATGTVTQNVKLIASDGLSSDRFGYSVSQSGNIGLVGAFADDIGVNSDQGSAYVFRSLDTATGTITQNVKLTASDGAAGDQFGYSVSQSGSIGLVGAYGDDLGANSEQGSAYVFRNLDTATGTVTQNVKLAASDGTANDRFGRSVSLDGDQFIIGAYGKNSSTGKAYSGSVSSVTTLDSGNTSKTISGISFVSQDDWIIGQTTDANQVTLSAGDTANVTASGKAIFIGKNAGSDNNTLIVAGSLIANQITIGAAGNTGNTLQIGTGGTLTAASIITNNGSSLVINGAVSSTSVVVDGKLSGSGVMANATLSGSGSINPGNSPGIMTAAATNPTGGLDYNFEFTAGNIQPTWNAPGASGNDVLRLTLPTPFTASLSAVNAVNIYLNAGALTIGEVFTGGFYTDSNAAFLSSISSGTFTYLVASVGGAIPYNGTNYDVYSGPLTFSLATVSQSANFGAGVVNGYTTQFTVVPEPGTCTLLGLGFSALLFRRRSGPQSEKI